MKCLLYVSCFILITGCSDKLSSITASQENLPCINSAYPKFSNNLYNASINVVSHHISGLLLIKSMPSGSLRAAFTSETGLTLFDFEWRPDGAFHKHQIIKKLDKRIIINTLRKDIELLILPESIRSTMRAYSIDDENKFIATRKKEALILKATKNCQSIEHIEVKKNNKSLVSASFHTSTNNVPDSVNIQHVNFDMKITLTRIDH